jgi:hypothetical protein
VAANLKMFHAAEKALTALGYQVENPVRHQGNPSGTWQDYMRAGLVTMLTCDGVALLPGWIQSRGARAEYSAALSIDIPVRELIDWLEASL